MKNFKNKYKKENERIVPSNLIISELSMKMKNALNRETQGKKKHAIWRWATACSLSLILIVAILFGVPLFQGNFRLNGNPFTVVAYAANQTDGIGMNEKAFKGAQLKLNEKVDLPMGKIIYDETGCVIEGELIRGFKCVGDNIEVVTFESKEFGFQWLNNDYLQELIKSGIIPRWNNYNFTTANGGDENSYSTENVIIMDENWGHGEQVELEGKEAQKLYPSGMKVTCPPDSLVECNWNLPYEYERHYMETGSYEYENVATILITAKMNDGQIIKQEISINIDRNGNISAVYRNVKT